MSVDKATESLEREMTLLGLSNHRNVQISHAHPYPSTAVATPIVSTTNTHLNSGATAIEDKLQEKVLEPSMQECCLVSET